MRNKIIYPRIEAVPGYGTIEFAGIAPSGNVMAYKPGDRARSFGPFCLMPKAADLVLSQLRRK